MAQLTDDAGVVRFEGTITGGGGGALIAHVTLDHAAILALPTTPAVIIPPTEILNYSTAPSVLPWPLPGAHTRMVKPVPTVYGNIDAGAKTYLAWGSDWSVSVATVGAHGVQSVQCVPAGPNTRWLPFGPSVWDGSPSELNAIFLDNALVLAVANGAAGDLTGGDAGDTLEIYVPYMLVSI